MTTATLIKENIYLGWLGYSSEFQFIIIMVGLDSVQADMVLVK